MRSQTAPIFRIMLGTFPSNDSERLERLELPNDPNAPTT